MDCSKEGLPGYLQVCNKGSRQSEHQRSAFYVWKDRNKAFYGWKVKEYSILYTAKYKPLGSLNSFLSYAPQLSGANLVSSFTLLLAFPQLLSSHHGGWCRGGVTESTGSQFWEPSFTFEGQKAPMAMTVLAC